MIEIRAAVSDDADAICDAHVTAWRVAYRGLFRDEFLDADEFDATRRTRWRSWNWTNDFGGELFVPVLDGEVVGFAHVGPVRVEPTCDESGTVVAVDPGAEVGEVYGFYLHPRAWGSGAAVPLMVESERGLRSAGFARSVLWVLRDNPRARGFYEKAGWSWTGETGEWSPPDEHPVAEVQYGRAL